MTAGDQHMGGRAGVRWLLALGLALVGCKREARDATTRPATGPVATRPASKPAVAYVPKVLFDVLKKERPAVAATRPFEVPLEMRDAAHYTIEGPLYLDRSRGDLWITRESAPAVTAVLRAANDEQTHVARERVRYVHWQPDESGNWFPHLVVEGKDGGMEVVWPGGKRETVKKRGYEFGRALSVNDLVFVPTTGGEVVVWKVGDKGVEETVHPLKLSVPSSRTSASSVEPFPVGAGVVLLLDYRGMVAFVPGVGRGIARYVDGKWEDLGPERGFPAAVLQVVPMLDGSALAIVPVGKDKVELQLLTLDAGAGVDAKAVAKLVEQLSDAKEEVRRGAFEQLSRYGPQVYPTLERLMEEQPPEAKVRLRQIMRARLKPSLGVMTLVNNDLREVSRGEDGSVVFYSGGGVSVANSEGEAQVITPAWISLRPGAPVRLLDKSMVKDLVPGREWIGWVSGEWVKTGGVNGVERFFGNEWKPVVKEGEREFNRLVGIDRRGRWVLARKDANVERPTSNAQRPTREEYLVIDPTLPDPAPRLPAWALEMSEGSVVGWDQKDEPALGSGDSGFALEESEWRPLDLKKERFLQVVEDVKPRTSATRPTTTMVATTQAVEDGALVGTGKDGARFYDGRERVVIVWGDGKREVVELPAEQAGTVERPAVMEADGHLFVWNQAGKIVRLSKGQDGAWTVDGVFTKNVPNADRPLRVWVDPWGRICFEPDGKHLVVFFPAGRIPPAIAEKMPADQLEGE